MSLSGAKDQDPEKQPKTGTRHKSTERKKHKASIDSSDDKDVEAITAQLEKVTIEEQVLEPREPKPPKKGTRVKNTEHKAEPKVQPKPGKTEAEIDKVLADTRKMDDEQHKEEEAVRKQGIQIGAVHDNLDTTETNLDKGEQELKAATSCWDAFLQALCCCCISEKPKPQHAQDFEAQHKVEPIIFSKPPKSRKEKIEELARIAEDEKKSAQREGKMLDEENAELAQEIEISKRVKGKAEKTNTKAKTVLK